MIEYAYDIISAPDSQWTGAQTSEQYPTRCEGWRVKDALGREHWVFQPISNNGLVSGPVSRAATGQGFGPPRRGQA